MLLSKFLNLQAQLIKYQVLMHNANIESSETRVIGIIVANTLVN